MGDPGRRGMIGDDVRSLARLLICCYCSYESVMQQLTRLLIGCYYVCQYDRLIASVFSATAAVAAAGSSGGSRQEWHRWTAWDAGTTGEESKQIIKWPQNCKMTEFFLTHAKRHSVIQCSALSLQLFN